MVNKPMDLDREDQSDSADVPMFDEDEDEDEYIPTDLDIINMRIADIPDFLSKYMIKSDLIQLQKMAMWIINLIEHLDFPSLDYCLSLAIRSYYFARYDFREKTTLHYFPVINAMLFRINTMGWVQHLDSERCYHLLCLLIRVFIQIDPSAMGVTIYEFFVQINALLTYSVFPYKDKMKLKFIGVFMKYSDSNYNNILPILNILNLYLSTWNLNQMDSKLRANIYDIFRKKIVFLKTDDPSYLSLIDTFEAIFSLTRHIKNSRQFTYRFCLKAAMNVYEKPGPAASRVVQMLENLYTP